MIGSKRQSDELTTTLEEVTRSAFASILCTPTLEGVILVDEHYS